MLRTAFLAFIGAIGLAAAPAAEAVPVTFTTTLAPEPSVDSEGTGSAIVVYDDETHMLSVSVEFSNLSGATTVAHIHCCVDPPGFVGVATTPGTFPGFEPGLTSGVYEGMWSLADRTSYTDGFFTASGDSVEAAEAALISGIALGRAYVNIHTEEYPGGEIRGFLALLQIPEPGLLALLLTGLAGLIVMRHRSSR